MKTPGMLISYEGQINHSLAHKLPDEELLDVAQLATDEYNNLPENLHREIKRRGLEPKLAELLLQSKEVPNH